MRIIYLSLIVLLLWTPTTWAAPDPGGTPQQTQQQINAAAAARTNARFQPGVSLGTGGSNSSYNSVSFSGVGGAVLSCAGAGKFLVKQATDLFNKTGIGKKLKAKYAGIAGDGGDVPVKDEESKKELAKQTQTEQCLNGVAYAMAKNALAQITNKTLNWIGTGFNGNPLYVRDPVSFMKSISDQKITEYTNYISKADPVFGNALRSVITQQVNGKIDGLLSKPMNTPEGKAYQAFQDDFTQGGWSAFLNMNNNSLGAYFKAVDGLSQSVNTAQQNVRDELQQGQGFLSMKKCAEWKKGSDGKPIEECARFETVTPGSVIAQQAAYITNSPVKQLEYADKINEVLGSFFDRMLSRFLSEGLAGLNNAKTRVASCADNGGGVGCNIVIGTDGQATGSDIDEDAFGFQSTGGGAFEKEFDISRPQQVRAVLKTQLDYINQSRDAQTVMTYIVPTLGRLDYCLPGPNPTWTSGLQENYGSFAAQLIQPDPEARSTMNRVLSSVPILGGFFSGDKAPPTILAAVQPNIFDKVTDMQIPISDQIFDGTGIPDNSGRLNEFREWLQKQPGLLGQNLGVGNGNGDVSFITAMLSEALRTLSDDYSTAFNLQTSGGVIPHGNVVKAFSDLKTTDEEKIDAANTLTQTVNETSQLISYNKSVTSFYNQYEENIAKTEEAVRELELIHKEVNKIVGVAKARYKLEREASGKPIAKFIDKDATGRPAVISCLDKAYTIDTSTPTGIPVVQPYGTYKQGGLFEKARLDQKIIINESIINQSVQASEFFYGNL